MTGHEPPRVGLVEAIKIYRQATGAALREAKAACEALARGGQP
jgi:ribosomal protein L7/L12